MTVSRRSRLLCIARCRQAHRSPIAAPRPLCTRFSKEDPPPRLTSAIDRGVWTGLMARALPRDPSDPAADGARIRTEIAREDALSSPIPSFSDDERASGAGWRSRDIRLLVPESSTDGVRCIPPPPLPDGCVLVCAPRTGMPKSSIDSGASEPSAVSVDRPSLPGSSRLAILWLSGLPAGLVARDPGVCCAGGGGTGERGGVDARTASVWISDGRRRGLRGSTVDASGDW